MRTEKRCSLCGEVKSLDAFNHGRCRDKVYPQGRCRLCNIAYGKKWQVENKEQAAHLSRKAHLKSTYAITVEDYNKMLDAQNGVCAICLKTCSSGHRLSVDHNHATGGIRGLLCHSCNVALGYVREDPATLQRMAAYLERAMN